MQEAFMIGKQALSAVSILGPVIALLVPTGSEANQCPLNGKSITIDTVVCPNREANVGPDCTRSRIRYGILKSSILEFGDEVTPRGIVYELDKTVDVTEHMLGREIPGTYVKAHATASYSTSQLRLSKERNRYLRNGTLVQSISFLNIIEVAGDCARCSVSRSHIETTTAASGTGATRETLLLAQQTCQVRDGV
jgi:hypothetical protein